MKQLRITKLSHVDSSTVSIIVKGLVQRGLVKRARSRKDQRAYGVRLTKDGSHALVIGEAVADNLAAKFRGGNGRSSDHAFRTMLAEFTNEEAP